MSAAIFAASFAALYAGHMVGDHWIQTGWQAANKGRHDHTGRLACAAHVATYTATQAVFLASVALAIDVHVASPWLLVGLSVSAVTHYWADRRFTLARLAGRLGKADFYRLGQPRKHKIGQTADDFPDAPYELKALDNPCLGTGAYALNQSFHIGWLFVAALIIAGGAA
jgi:hypothetical protein